MFNFHRHPCNDVARLWALRALVNLHGYKRLPGYPRDLSPDDDVLRLVGLGHLDYEQVNARGFVGQLREVHEDEEALQPDIEGNLRRNLNKLGELLGLNSVEQQILGFVVVLNSHDALEEAVVTLGNLNYSGLVAAIAGVLKIRRPVVAKALGSNSTLSQSGLLRLASPHPDTLKERLSPLMGLVDRMYECHRHPE